MASGGVHESPRAPCLRPGKEGVFRDHRLAGYARALAEGTGGLARRRFTGRRAPERHQDFNSGDEA